MFVRRQPPDLRSSRPKSSPNASLQQLLQLQRLAGNRAVTSLLQRQPASAGTATAAPAPSAPTLWPNGPTTARKSAQHSLADYVGWVKEVEAGYLGRENVVQRLRRLYYSGFVSSSMKAQGQKPGAGSRFDEVIRTSDASDSPLESPPISQKALDGLFETNAIVTPTGAIVDISHVWPDLDLAISGKTKKAVGGWALTGADFQGVLTWTGDLASWFLEFVDRIRKQTHKLRMPDAGSWSELDTALGFDSHKFFNSLVASKVDKDDLLGDLDAQAIVAKNVKPGHVYGGTPTANVSDMLLDFYQPSAGPPPEASRFAAFVMASRPGIPFEADPKSPSHIKLTPHVAGDIFQALYDTAELFLSQTQGHNVTPAGDLDWVLMEIAKKFRDFLIEGLLKGDAPWP